MGALGLHCFAFSLLLTAASVFLAGAQAKTDPGDVEVLKQLKNSVDPASVQPGSCLGSWDFAFDPCDSLFSDRFTCGFRCDSADSSGSARVTELALDQAGYSGSLSAVSWSLPFLESLDLSGNSFSGPVPGSFSNLTRLARFTLSRNSFSGPIPGSLGRSLPSLQELCLDNNAIEGSIPENFNSLSGLTRLELQSNKLAGKLPELGSLKALSYLDLSDNTLSSKIPSVLPPTLVQISMRNNLLEGTIPPTLQSLTYLQVLDLSHNRLGGAVPAALFAHPSLQQLTLSFNSLDWIEAPNALGLQSELIAVDLSNNRIRGFLPLFMSLMPKLSALSVENNLMSGMIPTEYAIKAAIPGPGVAQLSRLLLGGNYLFGPIPGLFLGLSPESVMNVSLADNCLYRCPGSFFFCQGALQKSLAECKRFGPMIP
ncbi:LRR receptor-like serine/threonine-protein kinase FLS2 [Punica granatum]|uniref:Uncharacterized protein n=2 Tax=Punica granatum TaxID=22663 RepID=A0A218XV05_PUNGR|nr:LRR receptor-like serine/threonine-protein kinase FLS2 [Punica granatum]OWM88877.1 hypothetical protein CDL15_Pgr020831 [Punica granatum]PKI48422.1 hypothetical protein CRG98_031174 [Punica granatum]